jgi:hypothetical protein
LATLVAPACSRDKKNDLGEPIGVKVEWSGTPFQLAVATSNEANPEDYSGAFSVAFVEAAKACPNMTTLPPDMTPHLEGRVEADKINITPGDDPLLKCIAGAINGKPFASKGKTFRFAVEIRSVKK